MHQNRALFFKHHESSKNLLLNQWTAVKNTFSLQAFGQILLLLSIYSIHIHTFLLLLNKITSNERAYLDHWSSILSTTCLMKYFLRIYSRTITHPKTFFLPSPLFGRWLWLMSCVFLLNLLFSINTNSLCYPRSQNTGLTRFNHHIFSVINLCVAFSVFCFCIQTLLLTVRKFSLFFN